jgi:hypothetical protein
MSAEPAVELTVKTTAMSVAFGTVSFFMLDGDKTIRVDIGRDVLAHIGGPPLRSKEAYMERLAPYRRQFARIAALKYHAGRYEPEVRVLVVHITKSDLR